MNVVRWLRKKITYSLLSPLPPHAHKRIMVLLDVQVQEMPCGEVLPTLETAMRVLFRVMDLILFERLERKRLSMGWERAAHGWFGGRRRRGCGGVVD